MSPKIRICAWIVMFRATDGSWCFSSDVSGVFILRRLAKAALEKKSIPGWRAKRYRIVRFDAEVPR